MKRAAIVLLGACAEAGAPPPAPPPVVTVVGCEVALRPVADVVELIAVTPPPDVAPIPPPTPPDEPLGLVVAIRPPRVDGGLSPAPVQRTLRKHEDAFRACYERRVAARPGLAGTITLDFTVDATGAVVMPSATGSDRPLGACFVDVLADVQFTEPRGGGAKVRVPITVHPEASAAPDLPPEPEPAPAPPAAPLASLLWADDGVDAGVETWAREQVPATLAALDLAGCVGDAVGTLRARLGVTTDATLVLAEVDGLGSAAVEDCVAERVKAAAIPRPPAAAAIACELTVRRPLPARVTERAGGPAIVRAAGHDDAAALVASARGLGDHVVAVRDATGALVLVTDQVRRGAGKPRVETTRPRIELANGTLAVKGGRSVSLDDRDAVRAVVAELDGVVELAVGAGVRAQHLADVAGQLPRVVLTTGPGND